MESTLLNSELCTVWAPGSWFSSLKGRAHRMTALRPSVGAPDSAPLAQRWPGSLTASGLQGFEEEVMGVLRRRYPPGMMSELQAACQASLSDLKAAFPDDTILANTSLQRFLQVVPLWHGLSCMGGPAKRQSN